MSFYHASYLATCSINEGLLEGDSKVMKSLLEAIKLSGVLWDALPIKKVVRPYQSGPLLV